MLQTNLATRPFYNVRLVAAALAAAGLVLLLLTVAHVFWALSLRDDEQRLSAKATSARQQADKLRAEAASTMARVDPDELARVSAAAEEVNIAIEQRAFSWTQLLSHLERTLPDDVRVTAIQPRLDDSGIRIALTVEALDVQHLSSFMDALEASGAFHNVIPSTKQQAEDDEVIDATIEGTYVGAAAPPRPKGAAARGRS